MSAIKNPPALSKSALASGSVTLDAAAFAALGGEVHAGKNILKLKPGTGAGPFRLVEILKNQKLGDDKKRKPVDVYVAETTDGVRMNMPVAASFVGRAQDAKLAVGDTFALFRGEDYASKKFGNRNCASYEIRVISRGAGAKK